MKSDLDIISRLGGPKKVAEMLGIAREPGAIQRVANWKRRGIPARILVANPEFYRRVKKAERMTEEGAHA